jgi:folate-binding protein YgfZ
MRFTLDVSADDVTHQIALLATPGATPDPGPGLWAWDDPWPGVVPGGTHYAPVEGHPGHRWRLRLTAFPAPDRATVERRLAKLGTVGAGTWALDALRIAAWRPWVGAAGVKGALPHELDWLRTAVHLRKGCYRGQETVAKIVNVGRPPRRVVMLHLDGSDLALPAPGAPVTAREDPAQAPIGVVTSAARHHLLGPIALALVTRGVDPTADLMADGVPTAQVLILPPGGASAARPRIDAPPGLGRGLGPGRPVLAVGSAGGGRQGGGMLGGGSPPTPGGRGIRLERRGSAPAVAPAQAGGD